MANRCLFPGKQGLEEFLELADFIPGIVGAKAPSVDGEGKRAVHPPNEAFWWMARAKWRFIHQKGHFGGWRGGMGRHATPG